MQSALEDEDPPVAVDRRLQSPLVVQHWPAIALPSGVVVALAEVMQQGCVSVPEIEPERAMTPKGGGGGVAGGSAG